MRKGKLLLVLGYRDYEEIRAKKDLIHGGGMLLKHMLDRWSIPRSSWDHTYVFSHHKNAIPTQKMERWQFLKDSIEDLKHYIQNYDPTEIIAMGALPCEVFTGFSRVTRKQGTCRRFRKEWQDLEVKRVWISLSTDACLFDPNDMVKISRVIRTAAKVAGIPIKPKPLNEAISFDWEPYL